MNQPGVLERIATALETIATALTGQPQPTRTPRQPDTDDARFEWEPDTGQLPVTALPEPEPAEERCGFLIEQYLHPLDRATLIYQVSKSGATVLVTQQEAARLAALDDEEFIATMGARLAEVLAQRHREARAEAPERPVVRLAPDVSDEEREREWARGATAGE